MSVSLQEILVSAGYDFDDYDDLKRMSSLLYEAEDLGAEIDDKIEEIERIEWEKEGREEMLEIERARRGQY